jgi:type III secretory pathway component EscU
VVVVVVATQVVLQLNLTLQSVELLEALVEVLDMTVTQRQSFQEGLEQRTKDLLEETTTWVVVPLGVVLVVVVLVALASTAQLHRTVVVELVWLRLFEELQKSVLAVVVVAAAHETVLWTAVLLEVALVPLDRQTQVAVAAPGVMQAPNLQVALVL